jgi:hypothetical protein
MSFGKYEGVWLDEVPRPYLRWLRANVPLGGLLARSVDYVLNHGRPPIPLQAFVADQLGVATTEDIDDAGD